MTCSRKTRTDQRWSGFGPEGDAFSHTFCQRYSVFNLKAEIKIPGLGLDFDLTVLMSFCTLKKAVTHPGGQAHPETHGSCAEQVMLSRRDSQVRSQATPLPGDGLFSPSEQFR